MKNSIDNQEEKKWKEMMKQVLDKLWKGPHKVNNKLDGYWYVRLSEVSKALDEIKHNENK